MKLPVQPKAVTTSVFKELSTRRMRDVLEKRFGLKGGKKKTLEAIGREYNITRERVRQIEVDALKQLRKIDFDDSSRALIEAVKAALVEHSGVMAEEHLLSSLTDTSSAPHVAFIMNLAPDFHYVPESTVQHACWAISKDAASKLTAAVSAVVSDIERGKKLLATRDLHQLMSQYNIGTDSEGGVVRGVEAALSTSKLIQQNPYGEYGLISWATVNPRGVRDKAHIALTKRGEPMHFREVAEEINKAGWSRRRAHPQTVHNELIKDERFVLVGRGLYALSDWGYEPGVVRDVLVAVMKESGKSLTKEEIIDEVSKKRLVKAPTILLNLQNKSLFKRTDDDRYQLA